MEEEGEEEEGKERNGLEEKGRVGKENRRGKPRKEEDEEE